MRLVTFLLHLRRMPLVGRLAVEVLRLYGADVPAGVDIGDGFQLHHRGMGVVIHYRTHIGDRVQIFQHVTIGKVDPQDTSYVFPGATIEDDAILGSGCQVLGGRDGITVSRGSIVAAGAVLLESTGPGEVWAGVPARRVRG